jgi:hypothetical protein
VTERGETLSDCGGNRRTWSKCHHRRKTIFCLDGIAERGSCLSRRAQNDHFVLFITVRLNADTSHHQNFSLKVNNWMFYEIGFHRRLFWNRRNKQGTEDTHVIRSMASNLCFFETTIWTYFSSFFLMRKGRLFRNFREGMWPTRDRYQLWGNQRQIQINANKKIIFRNRKIKFKHSVISSSRDTEHFTAHPVFWQKNERLLLLEVTQIDKSWNLKDEREKTPSDCGGNRRTR